MSLPTSATKGIFLSFKTKLNVWWDLCVLNMTMLTRLKISRKSWNVKVS